MAAITGPEFETTRSHPTEAEASSLSTVRKFVALYSRYFYLTSAVPMHTIPLLAVIAISGVGLLMKRVGLRLLRLDTFETV
jgi:hypothetical protein